jgi:hypothetical protein
MSAEIIRLVDRGRKLVRSTIIGLGTKYTYRDGQAVIIEESKESAVLDDGKSHGKDTK